MKEDNTRGRVIAISISEEKGTKKTNVETARLKENWGIEGDAHAGEWHRQISLLAVESIDKMKEKGLDVVPGSFAENITTEWLNLPRLEIGTRLSIGGCSCEVTQIGKECHTRCAIYHQAGDCVMPTEGIFCKVLGGGEIRVGDEIAVQSDAGGVGG